jgi:NADP-dependent 3-hydroxy acid dehydrogenase YdfG
MNTVSGDTLLLKNKRAIIFGAGGAVGTEVAKEFAAQGATALLSGRALDAIEQLAEELCRLRGLSVQKHACEPQRAARTRRRMVSRETLYSYATLR